MIRVRQRDLHDPANGVHGDCFRAAVASVMEIRLSDVPAFQLSPDSELDWGLSLVRFLEIRNWSCWQIRWDEVQAPSLEYVRAEFKRLIPDIPAVLSGPSPRFREALHCLALLDGEVWDPHPDATMVQVVFDAIVMANMTHAALGARLRAAGYPLPELEEAA